MSGTVALDLSKMAEFTNNDALDEYLESVVPACEWVEHAPLDLPEVQPPLCDPCCCHLEQVVFTTPCAMCDADFQATETDKSVIQGRHCPQHGILPIDGWPRPLCVACEQDWKIKSVLGGRTTLVHRDTNRRVLHGVVRVHQNDGQHQ
jgi:hypothetical protein